MTDFPPDFAIEFDEQTYRPLCIRPHVARNGQTIRLIEWLTNCPSCGTEFTVSTTTMFRSPRRRCDACKAPGLPVKSQRKRFLAQIRGDEP